MISANRMPIEMAQFAIAVLVVSKLKREEGFVILCVGLTTVSWRYMTESLRLQATSCVLSTVH